MRAAILSLFALGAALPALAESYEGSWQFRTDRFQPNCTISGVMEIKKPNAKGVSTCRFESVQFCPGGISYRVAQDCTARTDKGTLTIMSKVTKVISVTPKESLNAVERSYAPDNFAVTLSKDASEMLGEFFSLSRAPVKFWRKKDLVS